MKLFKCRGLHSIFMLLSLGDKHLFIFFKPTAGLAPSLYDFAAAKMDGESLPISSLAGKAVLMLNVASR